MKGGMQMKDHIEKNINNFFELTSDQHPFVVFSPRLIP